MKFNHLSTIFDFKNFISILNNIITFSLWGNNPIYWTGALKNIELANLYYPGWICRFYIDKDSKKELVETIKGDNVEVVLMQKNNNDIFNNIDVRFNHSGLYWRFLALKDTDVNIILSRDCDSRLSQREVDAVNEWIESDKDFHIMRDHPYHQVPILSGMWGARNKVISNIDEYLSHWKKWPHKGKYHAEDQDFLGQIIYPIIKDISLEHSEFNINYGSEIKSFPSVRKNYEFVGDVFDDNNKRHPDFWQILKKYCK
jgi:hypothetical protein